METRKEVLKKNMNIAKAKLKELGILPHKENSYAIYFTHKGHEVIYYPGKSWFTGRSVSDGRGLSNLLIQLNGKKVVSNHKVSSNIPGVIIEYWIIDRSLFMSLGKVNTPIMQSNTHSVLKEVLPKFPNGVIVLTKYQISEKGNYKVFFQQISRNGK